MQEGYSDSWGTEFAGLFKVLEKPENIGVVTGNVVSISPLTIEIMDGNVLINSSVHDVFVSSNLLGTYGRDMEGSGQIQFSDSDCGVTDLAGACQTAGDHTHKIESLNINTDYNFTGKITHTDTIKVGDFVMVVPDEEEQAFFVVSKLVKVGGS